MTGTVPPGAGGSASALRRFAALWFCYFAAIGAFNPYAPLWFKELGFSTLAIGTIASLQAWTRVLAPYAWGWWADHHGGRTRLIRLGAAVSVLAAAALLWSRGYSAVALCVVLLFLANGAVIPLSEAQLGRYLAAPGGGMDSARYGRVRMWGSVGFITAVTLYGGMLEFAGIHWFPVLVLLMYGLLWGATLRVPAGAPEAPSTGAAPAVWPVLRRPEVAWFFASVFFTVLAHTALYAFFSLHLDALGFGKTTVGLLWGASVLVEIVFFWVQGRLLPSFDAQRWLATAAAVSALRFAITAACGASVPWLLLAQGLHAITFAAQHVACIVIINRHFGGALRARGQALYSVLGYGLSGVIGGVAGGWLSSRAGFAAVFWAASAIALVGWGCALMSRRAGAAAAPSSPGG